MNITQSKELKCQELKKMIDELFLQHEQVKVCDEHKENVDPEQISPKKREKKIKEKKERSDSQIARDKEKMASLRARRGQKSNDTPK